MTKFKAGDFAVVVRGPNADHILEAADDYKIDEYHYFNVGSIVEISYVMNAGSREDWGTQYEAVGTDYTQWNNDEDLGSQFVFDIHLEPFDAVDLSPTSVEDFLNGRTGIVGGLLKTSHVTIQQPLDGSQ